MTPKSTIIEKGSKEEGRKEEGRNEEGRKKKRKGKEKKNSSPKQPVLSNKNHLQSPSMETF